LVPPVLVPNIKDQEKLAYHISIMFYIIGGVATLLFILVVIGKVIRRLMGLGQEGSTGFGGILVNMALKYHGH
jgi:hypothetical protein